MDSMNNVGDTTSPLCSGVRIHQAVHSPLAVGHSVPPQLSPWQERSVSKNTVSASTLDRTCIWPLPFVEHFHSLASPPERETTILSIKANVALVRLAEKCCCRFALSIQSQYMLPPKNRQETGSPASLMDSLKTNPHECCVER